jgi:hypothetical protein
LHALRLSPLEKQTMPAAKTNKPAASGGLLSAIFRPSQRGALIIVAILVVAGGAWGAYAVWQQIRGQVAASDDYRLTPQEIEITPPPPWVRGDVKAEALRSAGIDGPLSILDDDLVQKIQTAFSLHPWVANVVRVSKQHPAHVDVELTYRRPVAMVEVHENGSDGLYPVDIDGVLLPSNDFSPLEARSYPRLAGVESSPLGAVGSRWGDPVVAGGARIAAALSAHWAEWKLWSIRWLKPATGSDASAPADFDLITGAGQAIHWGAAPANEPPGEPTADQKIAQIKTFVDQHGSLDDPAAKAIDLSQPGGAARTAKASEGRKND